jgi:hypothetical protein
MENVVATVCWTNALRSQARKVTQQRRRAHKIKEERPAGRWDQKENADASGRWRIVRTIGTLVCGEGGHVMEMDMWRGIYVRRVERSEDVSEV